MRVAAALVVIVAACGDNTSITTVPMTSGPATLTLADDGSALVFARAGRPLLVFHADAFQAGTVDDLDSGDSFDPYWLYTTPPNMPASLEWRTATRLTATVSTPEQLVLALDNGATVTFARGAPGCFDLTLAASAGKPVAFLRVAPDADATENFYGLGEWGDSVAHRGKLRPMQMEANLMSESSDNEDHVPVPLLVGTRGWGVFVASDRAGAFDVARQSPTRVEITFGTGDASPQGLAVHLFSEDAPLDILRDYFALAGEPGLPAPWAYGPLLWRDENTNQAQVIDDLAQIRARHLATSGVWFDRPYATGVETFDFDPAKFPDAPAMLQALHDAGLRYGIWQAPYTAAATNDQDPAPAQHDYAEAHGFFPPVTAVLVNQWGKPIDFTNPAAYAWWSENLAAYTRPLGGGGLGVEGFKLDYAEDVVVGLIGQRARWLFADGSDERTMHRGYQLLYHQIHRELLAPEGAFLLTRTGRWGDQTRGMIIWPGDLDADFSHEGDPIGGTLAVGGLPAALIKGIGLSASGFPFYTSDTAGYRHSPAGNECWLRWVEANTIASAMEVGDSSSEQPWEFTAQNGRTQHSLDVYQRYARLHLRLYPYAWTYAKQIATTGRPIVRPFGLAHPEVGAHPDDEYLFGDALLVAPVVAAGQTMRDVWFPPGAWIDWWTGTLYDGSTTGAQHAVPADLDTLPLFVVQGGIVPMLRDTIETLAPVAASSTVESFARDPGTLWVRVVPGPASTFAVYDGTKLAQAPGGMQYAPGSVFSTAVLFERITTAMPASVHNGSTVLAAQPSLAALVAAPSGWFWEPATGGTLWVKVTGPANVATD